MLRFIGNTSRPSGGRPGRELLYPLALREPCVRAADCNYTVWLGEGGGETLKLQGLGL